MPTRPKHTKGLRKPFQYGTSLYDYRQDGPTTPMFTCTCPTCGHTQQHTNKERVHYCTGSTVESSGKRHDSIRMIWDQIV